MNRVRYELVRGFNGGVKCITRGGGENPGRPNPKSAGIPGATDGETLSGRGEAGGDEQLTQSRTPAEHRILVVRIVGE